MDGPASLWRAGDNPAVTWWRVWVSLRAFSSQPSAAAVAILIEMLYGGISSAAVQLPLLDLASAFPDLPPAPAHPPRFHCSQSSLRWDDYYCEFSIGAMFVTAIVSGLLKY